MILPAPRLPDRILISETVYQYPHWHNVDKISNEGVDELADIFTYPFIWEDDEFGGALIEHVAEHIPHETKISPIPGMHTRELALKNLQNGFFAFFSEVWRVLEPGAIAHIVVPMANSWESHVDPDHKRQFVPATFSYLCEPSPNASYSYNIGCKWEFAADVVYSRTGENTFDARWGMQHLVNTVNYFYVQLAVVK